MTRGISNHSEGRMKGYAVVEEVTYRMNKLKLGRNNWLLILCSAKKIQIKKNLNLCYSFLVCTIWTQLTNHIYVLAVKFTSFSIVFLVVLFCDIPAVGLNIRDEKMKPLRYFASSDNNCW